MMATVLPIHSAQSGDERRWAVGVLVSAKCRRVSAALVGIAGQGLEAHFNLAGAVGGRRTQRHRLAVLPFGSVRELSDRWTGGDSGGVG